MVENEKPANSPAAEAHPPQAGSGKKNKKKKFKYSKGFLGRFQKLERGMMKAEQRIASAVESGLSSWIEARDRSATQKRDGAIKDAVENATKALAKVARKAAKAPQDVIGDLKPQIKPKKWLQIFVPPEMQG